MVHSPFSKVTQDVSVFKPPQATRPDWVWKDLDCGRFGKLHQGLPSSSKISTDFGYSSEGSSPPVTMITESKETEV